MPTSTQRYGTISPFIKEQKQYVSQEDAIRMAAYDAYYDFYWNNPDLLAVVQRGDNDNPIYLPLARIIVNTLARYICPDFSIVPDPGYGTDSEKLLMSQTFQSLFDREGFYSKFISNKLAGIIKGDALWYISADPDKPQGSRITIKALDPSLVVKIEDPTEPDRIWGYDILEEINANDTPGVKRTRWLKPGHEDNPSDDFVCYSIEAFEEEGFTTPERKTLAGVDFDIEADVVLDGITHLPIYHISNLSEDGFLWGSSEMRGLESLIGGLNQSISDEDLTLALQGIGFYWTDGGGPVDSAGNPTEWEIGPGQVAEVGAGRKFDRVSGVSETGIAAMQKHMEKLEDAAYRVNGTGDVSQGIVSVEAAESGIALRLRLAPLLETAGQKQLGITTILNQMLFDLREWLAVYEQVQVGEARMICATGDPIPVNVSQRLSDLMSMYTAEPPLISGKTFRSELIKLGYDIPADDLITAVQERQQYFEAVQGPDAYTAGGAQPGPDDEQQDTEEE